MSYSCPCVGGELPGDVRPHQVVLRVDAARGIGPVAVVARRDCPVCGGTGDVPELPAGAACSGCGEAEAAVLSASQAGVRCANCDRRADLGRPFPNDEEAR
jgi:hypothetical protein